MQLPFRRTFSSKANNRLQFRWCWLVAATPWLLPSDDSNIININRKSELLMWKYGIVHRTTRVVFNCRIWSSKGIFHEVRFYSTTFHHHTTLYPQISPESYQNHIKIISKPQKPSRNRPKGFPGLFLFTFLKPTRREAWKRRPVPKPY